MNIGLLGADDLCKRNEIIFSEIDCETLLIHKETDLEQIDGLWLSAWRPMQLARLLPLQKTLAQEMRKGLTIAASGAASCFLGQNGSLKLMNYKSYFRPQKTMTYRLLNVPSWPKQRFCAAFGAEIRFFALAPNLGIISKDTKGPVIIRQGNFLACSFLPEWTKEQEIYHYFRLMTNSSRRK